MYIQVLGSGCPTCKKLFELTKQAITELTLKDDVELEYITDVTKIIEMGIMTSPVLTVNGKPVMIGGSQDIEKIKKSILFGALVTEQKSSCSCGGGSCC